LNASGVEIKGLEELQSALKQFPQNIQKNIMRGAVRAGASLIAKDAKANVPSNTGVLKDSIGIVAGKPKNKNFIRFWVTPREGFMRTVKFTLADGTKWKIKGEADGWYAHMVEFGTHSKRIEPLSPKTKYYGKRKKKRDAIVSQGGGSPAQPFMRPAYENKGEEAIEATKEYLAKRIDKEVQKAKK